jgi:D-3-phosphoglycerate dehydrogenase / 2-oxoglutarate reductase
MDYARSKGIKVFITNTRPSPAVAELVLGLILNFYRKINISSENLKNKIWKKVSGPLLNGKTVGIVGLGHIGKQLSLLLKGFNCKVLAYDIYKDESFAEENGIIFKDIKELISESDIISLHLDLNNKTRNFLDKEKLEKMKKNCLLVNASRGEIVDEEALYASLVNNKIMGACLDVFNEEPYNGPLLDLKNVLSTPHIGSYANEIRVEMELEATNNLIMGLQSEI